jgi:glycosyltransferase involved in cell wall biosynthesis
VQSVLASDYPAELLRVVVCDGRSTDRTAFIVRDMAAHDARVVLLLNEQMTTPFALNLGIRYSTDCDVHIILGAHAEIAPDYISRCVHHLKHDQSIGCVGGIIDNIHEDVTSARIGKAMSSPFGVGNAHFRTGTQSGFVDTVAFGAYRREVFERCGLFDEELIRNQDDEFNFRISKAGFRIFLDPAIRSRYYVRASYAKLWRQYYQYGVWKVYVNKKHGVVTSVRQLVPPLFVLFLIAWLFAGMAGGTIQAVANLLLGVYIAGAVVFAARQKAKLADIPGVMWSFFILHLAYGFGFWEGLIRFIVLRQRPGQHHTQMSR